jgi:GrpB-like predicted nucleotidyltransferase (UPF0157 family)
MNKMGQLPARSADGKPATEGNVVLTIRIVPHDASWAEQQAREVERLKLGLGGLVIEPVGSTAVPGLAAKPVLDLLVGLDAVADAQSVVSGLVDLGYRQGQSLSGEPGIAFLELADPANGPPFHLHVAPRDSDYWRDMIAFRDALRRDPQLGREYELLKRRLAAEHPTGIDAYSAGKSGFVARVLGRAQ